MDIAGIAMMVVVIAVFYFLMIRPENKKRKAEAEMRSKLKVGDDIQTIDGIIGTICAVKETTFVIETGADRVRLEFVKEAIAAKTSQDSEEPSKKEKKKSDEAKSDNQKN